MSDMTVGSISFGHLAESNFYKAEMLRLDAENLELKRRTARLERCLERCIPSDNAVANERIELLRPEDKW
jgi:hypothetical protein